MTEKIELPVGEERLREFYRILNGYKAGKASTERRVISSENWWKLRAENDDRGGFKSVSGWLHNVVVSKHADAMDAYPEPNVLPREEGDRAEAAVLSSIIPVIFEENRFEQTYSDAMWQKMKTGTGIYKVAWDGEAARGAGDIRISRVSVLNLFWEPGVNDIRDSPYVFHTELTDDKEIVERWGVDSSKLGRNAFFASRFLYDDAVPTSGKSTVIEVYYRVYRGGRPILHYAKFVGDCLLYATENDPYLSETGLYDHGRYPFVFDPLFPIEGSPCGYGYVDLCRNPQTAIDKMDTAFIKNAVAGATPRFFKRPDAGINTEQFLDLDNTLIEVANTDEAALRPVGHNALSSVYLGVVDRKINELRQTSGNTETATGTVSSGVTAASAIAALQEASGKGSRDASMASYRAFSDIVTLVIELIRQFYTLPRQFRIVGESGREEFITYTNTALNPAGRAEPLFDVKIVPARHTAYAKMSQNELALQLFKLGFFDPKTSSQALACVRLMEFEGKERVMRMISQNGELYRRCEDYKRLATALAKKYEPELADGIENEGAAGAYRPTGRGSVKTAPRRASGETPRMKKARAAAAGAPLPR